ncbi:hypothetical protein CYLTODRAFT_388142 [Cylindrobasidium torrendii FP15055 ss-10]|uniref:Pentacotripeptide-repeat region of PRORP domain-containing protein n=1 Tax=Cylindrobasidium torrendii FP15055 ss-10 TaxID=1314674 RepID=A0A0D7BQP6_9AGAR|nr:hypothetical protein CYLTODRAFT_388142 [Cylindrobasidium torrendii FP15055 ss-10]
MPSAVALINRAALDILPVVFRIYTPPCRRTAATARLVDMSPPTSVVRMPPLPLVPINAHRTKTPPLESVLKSFRELMKQNPSLESLHDHVQNASDVLQCLQKDPAAALLLVQKYPERAPLIISLLHRVSDRPLKKNVYETALYHLASQKEWAIAAGVVALAIEHDRLSTRTLNWGARAALELRDYAYLANILDVFTASKFTPQRRTYHIALEGFLRNGDLGRTKSLLDKMTADGIPPDASTQGIIAMHHQIFGANASVHEQGLAALEQLPVSVATAVLNSLLRQSLDAHDIDGAILVLSHFQFSLATPIFAALLDITPSADSPFPTAHNGIPDAGTYAVVLNHLAPRADRSLCIGLVHNMARLGIPPDGRILSGLVHLYIVAGDEAGAVQLVCAMCTQESSRILHRHLKVSKTTHKFPLDPASIPPSTLILNTLLRGLLPSHGLKAVKAILRVLGQENLQPNRSTIAIILQHLIRIEAAPAAAISQALGWLNQAATPDRRQLHGLLSRVLRQERLELYGRGWDLAAALHSKTRDAVLRDSDENHFTRIGKPLEPTAGIQAPSLSRSSQSLGPILSSLRSRGHANDSAAFALRLQRDAVRQELTSAQYVFDSMVRRGFRPNEYHFGALMDGFARAGNMAVAYDLLQNAKHVGIQPNVVMYTILIAGYARLAEVDKAEDAFEEMVSSGLQPDVGAIDAVVSAHFIAGQYKSARKTLIDLWPYISTVPAHLTSAPLHELMGAFRKLGSKPDVSRRVSKKERKAFYRKMKELKTIFEGVVHSNATVETAGTLKFQRRPDR